MTFANPNGSFRKTSSRNAHWRDARACLRAHVAQRSRWAIKVIRLNGEQLSYVPAHVSRGGDSRGLCGSEPNRNQANAFGSAMWVIAVVIASITVFVLVIRAATGRNPRPWLAFFWAPSPSFSVHDAGNIRPPHPKVTTLRGGRKIEKDDRIEPRGAFHDNSRRNLTSGFARDKQRRPQQQSGQERKEK